MIRLLSWIATFIVAMIPISALAMPADIVQKHSITQVPCRTAGYTHLDACVIWDVAYEASAPRTDLILEQRKFSGLLRRYHDVAVIHRFRATTRHLNLDSVVNVWNPAMDFVAQFRVKQVRSVVFVQLSRNGGKTWSQVRSPTTGVHYDITF